jgi:hypothetical protein
MAQKSSAVRPSRLEIFIFMLVIPLAI